MINFLGAWRDSDNKITKPHSPPGFPCLPAGRRYNLFALETYGGKKDFRYNPWRKDELSALSLCAGVYNKLYETWPKNPNFTLQMAHILIVSATQFEIQPLLEKYSIVVTGDGLYESFITETRSLSVLITGIGMVNTAFMMGKHLHRVYDAILNVGICGSFDRHLKLGQVVHITHDELSEMGAEDGDQFIKYKDLELPGANVYHNHWIKRSKELADLKTVKAITVNKVHGNDQSITFTKKLFNPDVESMEGGAFFAACKGLSNFTQVRAVSNYVERRNKSKWEIPLAILHLNKKVLDILTELFDAY